MANIVGTSFTYLDTIVDAGALELNGAQDVATAVLGGVTYVYVGSRFDNGIQVFTMDGAGTLTPVGSITDTGGITLNGLWELETFEFEGAHYLVANGQNDDGITLFSLSDAAPYLTFADRALDSDDVDYNLNIPVGLSVLQVASGGTFIYASGFGDNGLSIFRVGSGGTLTNTANIDHDGVDWYLTTTLSSFIFERLGSTFLVTTSDGSDAINVAVINTVTGIPSPVASVQDGGINRPWGGDAVVIDGTAYLYIANSNGDSISILEFDFSSLTIKDTLSSGLLDSVNYTQVVEVGNKTLLVTQAASEDNFTVFEIDTDPLSFNKGLLTPVETFTHLTGVGELNGATSGQMVEVDGAQFMLVVALNSDAINVYEIGGGDDVLEGTAFSDEIEGRGGDDVIYALDGNDVIDGGDGDDVIYAQGGNDLIDGGSGDDVIFAGSGSDTVMLSTGEDSLYGGSEIDIVDASAFDGLSGVTIDFLRNEIFLPDGTKQFITGFEVSYGTDGADTLVGTDGVNTLLGLDGDDTIRARDGDDFVYGGVGDDRLFGSTGDDFIDGGVGFDLLNGGLGDDTLLGGAQNDRLFGGDGNDTLDGGADNDLLKGVDGNDNLAGGAGNDVIEGQQGDDFMRGQAGNDVLIGGGGRDRINGGSGNDLLTGGSAIDTFVFQTVAAAGGGFNRITDFQDGLDLIDLTDYGFANVGEVQALATQVGSSARLTFSDGQIVQLDNLAIGDFDASDFIL